MTPAGGLHFVQIAIDAEHARLFALDVFGRLWWFSLERYDGEDGALTGWSRMPDHVEQRTELPG